MLAVLGSEHLAAARLRAAGEVPALRYAVDVRMQGSATEEPRPQEEMQLHWLPFHASPRLEVVPPQPEHRSAASDGRTESGVKETWKDVPGYEGLYKVCCDGRVLSMGREIAGVRRGTVCKIRYKQKLLDPQCGAGRQRARVLLYGREGTKPREFYICDLVCATFGADVAQTLSTLYRKGKGRVRKAA